MSSRNRVVFHVDMDAFYASVEQRDHPEFRGRPVIVGASPEHRGVVCAASYEARAFGVKSAMPSVTAGKLCPRGIFVRPRMEVYREESRHVMAILNEFSAVTERMSVDEAYLDLSEGFGNKCLDAVIPALVERARALKGRIWRERGLRASVGVAGNKMLAKLASDFDKPDGLIVIPERDKVAFLSGLPVDRIHGVGQVTAASLRRAGLSTIGDIQTYPADLQALVGSWGATLKRFALGEDNRPVVEDDTVKSISSETTFDVDTEDRTILKQTLREQAREISESLRGKRLQARTVQVKVRYSDFTTLTRQMSYQHALSDERQIYRAACQLLARHELVKSPLRLLGLGVSGLLDDFLTQLEFPFATNEAEEARNSQGPQGPAREKPPVQ